MSLPKPEIIEPRAYRNDTDLDQMCALLQAGRKANNGTYYIHIGDLKWWLFYPAWEYDPLQHISLWDDPADPARLLGWALLSLHWGYFDVYVQPELRGTLQAESMYIWAEQKLEAAQRLNGKEKFFVMWISQRDDFLNTHYPRRGLQRTPEDVVYMSCPLTDSLEKETVPPGYTVRSADGEVDVHRRAVAQYGAFGSTLPMDRYAERIRRFMQSPVYDPELNVIAVDPDGQAGSFCTVWPDAVNKVGLFEPVGTHPDFKRRGLGRAVMCEALQRLRDHGMTGACVCTSADNTPAIKLYESVGFRVVDIHLTYKKDL